MATVENKEGQSHNYWYNMLVDLATIIYRRSNSSLFDQFPKRNSPANVLDFGLFTGSTSYNESNQPVTSDERRTVIQHATIGERRPTRGLHAVCDTLAFHVVLIRNHPMMAMNGESNNNSYYVKCARRNPGRQCLTFLYHPSI